MLWLGTPADTYNFEWVFKAQFYNLCEINQRPNDTISTSEPFCWIYLFHQIGSEIIHLIGLLNENEKKSILFLSFLITSKISIAMSKNYPKKRDKTDYRSDSGLYTIRFSKNSQI